MVRFTPPNDFFRSRELSLPKRRNFPGAIASLSAYHPADLGVAATAAGLLVSDGLQFSDDSVPLPELPPAEGDCRSTEERMKSDRLRVPKLINCPSDSPGFFFAALSIA